MSSKSSRPAMVSTSAVVRPPVKEAVDVFVRLGIHHGADGLAEQVGIHLHLAPVVGGLAKQAAHIRHRQALAFAGATHQIEQAFDFGVIGNDLAVLADVGKVIGWRRLC